jgi:hypothetical protein
MKLPGKITIETLVADVNALKNATPKGLSPTKACDCHLTPAHRLAYQFHRLETDFSQGGFALWHFNGSMQEDIEDLITACGNTPEAQPLTEIFGRLKTCGHPLDYATDPITQPCPECSGTGYTTDEPCPHCNGEGVLYLDTNEGFATYMEKLAAYDNDFKKIPNRSNLLEKIVAQAVKPPKLTPTQISLTKREKKPNLPHNEPHQT